MALSVEQEARLAAASLQQVLRQHQDALLPTESAVARRVERVVRRIVAEIEPRLVPPGTQWRVFVVESPVANAFVLPGACVRAQHSPHRR